MNKGAIAISSEILLSGDKASIQKILVWIEKNIKNQKMFVDRTQDISYFFGESELFKEAESTGAYMVYRLIINDEKNIELYETGISIYL